MTKARLTLLRLTHSLAVKQQAGPSDALTLGPVENTASVLLSLAGAIRGERGPAGFGDSYSNDFGAPALSWVVNHNLGRYPVLKILSAGNVEIEAEVVHASVNQAVIYFAGPQAGRVLAI